MLCSRFLRTHASNEKHNRFYNYLENGLARLRLGYEKSLRKVMERRFDYYRGWFCGPLCHLLPFSRRYLRVLFRAKILIS